MTKNILLTVGMIFICVLTQAQVKKQTVITTSFEVSGVCQMCKDRIEKAVDVKGVKTAEYDLHTHTLTLTYSTKHISEEDIHSLLNAVGHDTEKSMASDEEYKTVHHCCKYREDEHNH
jgi:copper chaperone CopZ